MDIQEKIIEMHEKFKHLKQIFNLKILIKKVILPLEFIKSNNELNGIMKNRLNNAEKREYMSLVGSIGHIVVSLRFNGRFAYLILAKRLSNPRK